MYTEGCQKYCPFLSPSHTTLLKFKRCAYVTVLKHPSLIVGHFVKGGLFDTRGYGVFVVRGVVSYQKMPGRVVTVKLKRFSENPPQHKLGSSLGFQEIQCP